MRFEKLRLLVLYLSLLSLLTVACSPLRIAQKQEIKPTEEHLRVLAEWMSGRFSSQEQAEKDNSYHNISLIMKPIWQDRSDGVWLYVEQALAANPTRPYRQRVYQLVQYSDTLFESKVFRISDEGRYAGAWRMESPLADLSVRDLVTLPYCGVVLRGIFGHDQLFRGKTVGSSCGSEMHGAVYVESEVTITPDRMISWDKGMNEDGEQVWGPSAGGYIFNKIENFSAGND
jgi:CpeT protein